MYGTIVALHRCGKARFSFFLSRVCIFAEILISYHFISSGRKWGCLVFWVSPGFGKKNRHLFFLFCCPPSPQASRWSNCCRMPSGRHNSTVSVAIVPTTSTEPAPISPSTACCGCCRSLTMQHHYLYIYRWPHPPPLVRHTELYVCSWPVGTCIPFQPDRLQDMNGTLRDWPLTVSAVFA